MRLSPPLQPSDSLQPGVLPVGFDSILEDEEQCSSSSGGWAAGEVWGAGEVGEVGEVGVEAAPGILLSYTATIGG